jgi:hypothetical protein
MGRGFHPGPKSQYKICDYIEKVIINEQH